MQSIVPADIGLTSGYGIGFQVDRRDNYVAFGHGGAVAGYTSMLFMNRPKGIGVIVLSNGARTQAVLPNGLSTSCRSETQRKRKPRASRRNPHPYRGTSVNLSTATRTFLFRSPSGL
jgi:CubicO group peptidase (beta-lactamase class C family)